MKRFLLIPIMSIFCLIVSAQTKTWVGPTGGSFNIAANWNPAGIPGPGNDVIIPTGSNLIIDGADIRSIALQGNSVASLTNALTFRSASTIAANATVNWTNGYLNGVTLTNNGTINLTGTNSKGMDGNTMFVNNGTLNINSDGLLILTNVNHTLNNTSSGVININAGGQITHMLGSGSGLLKNSGLIKKQQSTDWFGILADFHNNNGTITVTDGNLTLDTPNAVLTDGLYNVTNGNTFQWSSVVTLEGTLTGQLDGQLSWLGNVNVPAGTEAILNFSNPSGINWNSGELLGGGTLSNTGVINLVSGGWGISAQSTLKNEGAINFNNTGYLVLSGNSTLENTNSGIIYLNAGGQITYGTGSGTLLNSGLVKKQDSTDWFGMYATMNNLASGTFESETGLLEFMNYAGTGTLTGNGSVKLPNGTNFEGTISPGGFPGTLTHEGTYTAATNAILATEIYGANPSTEHDVFDVIGNASLDGNILVSLNYAANLNDEFVILTATSISSCNLPSTVTAHYDNHNYTFDVICNPTNLTLKVTNIVLGTEENSLNNLSVYPNPSNGDFTIDLGREYSDVTVQIINMLGKIISSEKYASAKTINQQINVSAGIYIVKVSTANEGSNTLRVIKQ